MPKYHAVKLGYARTAGSILGLHFVSESFIQTMFATHEISLYLPSLLGAGEESRLLLFV